MARVVLSQGALPNTDGADVVEVQLGTVTSLADALNVGTSGVSVVADPSKSGTLLRFHSLNNTDGSISVTLDGINNEIVLAAVPGAIDHGGLLGAIDTIDHTTIDLRLPTEDEKGAMVGAVSPSAANPFVTLSELPPIPGDVTGGQNVNAAGVGVFEAKAGADLTFRGIVGTGALLVSLDAPNSEIELSLSPGLISHQTLAGAGTLTHAQIDAQTPTTAQKAALTNAASPSASNPFATVDDISLLAATGANINTAGIGVFDGQSGNTLQFRGIASDNSALSIQLFAPANEIRVGLLPGQIAHGALADSGVIDHTSIDLLLPDTDEKAAMQGANTPQAGNPFATFDDLPTVTLAEGQNVNNTGIGVFHGQNGNALGFRGVEGTGAITASLNPSDATIELGLTLSAIDHDSLAGTGLNTHGAIDNHIADGAIHYNLSTTTPSPVSSVLALTGGLETAARADHTHEVLTGAPVAIGAGNFSGSLAALSRADHSHAIRETSGPTDLTVGAILDGQAVKRTGGVLEGFYALSLGAALPEVLTPGPGAVGVASTAAPLDHRHAIATGTTATAIDASTVSSGGSGTSYSLSGHSHAIDTASGALSPITAGAVAGQGTDLGLARISHTHAVTTGAAGSISVGAASAEGTGAALARASHTHALPAPGPATSIDATPSTSGSSDRVAREDHRHRVLTASTRAIGQANAAGGAVALARADHDHLLREGTGVELALGPIADGDMVTRSGTSLIGAPLPDVPPLTADVPQAVQATGGAAGSEPEAARADHIHATVTAAAVSLDASTSNAIGAGNALARASHTHAISTAGTLSAMTPGATASDGSALGFATKSHTHAVPVGAPATLVVGGANDPGESSDFVRGDHVHGLPPFGDGPGEFAEGTDARFPTTDEKAALVGASGNPSASNRYVLDDDARLLPNDAQGAALGDLSGSYPAPSVVGLTAAGSSYTFGAWNDGEVLRRVGAVIESAALPVAAVSLPATLTPDEVGTIGTVASAYALADHAHPINAGPTIAIGQANAEGNANEFARSDHDHLLREGGGAALTIGAVGDGQFLFRSGSEIIGAGATISGPAGGDLSGSYPAPIVVALTDSLATSHPIGALTNDQFLKVDLGGTITTSPIASLDVVKVSANDAISDYLEAKLTASGAFTWNEINDAGNEQLSLSANFGTTAGTICEGNDPRFATITGPQGGDLSGFLPTASVIAITDSGATSHPIGALANDEFLKLDGAGNIVSQTIAAGLDERVSISGADTTPGYLDAKLTAGNGLVDTIDAPGGNESLRLDLVYGLPVDIGSANAIGLDTVATVRRDHVHAHGAQGGGTQHQLAQANGLAGFLSGADKAKLDGLGASSTNVLFDHFMSGNSDSDEIGSAGWRLSATGAGSDLDVTAVGGHPGVVVLSSGTAAAGRVAIHLGGDSQPGTMLIGGASDIFFEALIHFETSIAVTDLEHIQIGLGQEVGDVGEFLNGVYVRFNPSVSTAFSLVSANAGTRTETTGSTLVAIHTWYRVGFVITDPNGTPSIQMYINGTAEGSPITTDIPTIALAPVAKIDGAGGAASPELYVDYFQIQQQNDLED